MPQLLTVSRAARLVGVTRSALQKKIHHGELPTFEGQVNLTDLLRTYPQTQMEDNAMLERVERIKAQATPAMREKPPLPSPEVLISRLMTLSHELIAARNELNHYQTFFKTLTQKLQEITQMATTPLREDLQALSTWLIQELQQHPKLPDDKAQLLVKDTFLRIMAAQVKVIPSGHEFFVEGADSLLGAALRAGLTANYGCSSGNCGACKARVVSGKVWKIRDHDYILSQRERDMGYMLMCCNTALTDLVIEAAEAHSADEIPLQKIATKAKRLEYLSEDLLILHLQTPRSQTLRFMAGQAVTLKMGEELMADYFMANCPCDGRNLQFHLRKTANNPFVTTVSDKLKTSQTIELEGPKGHFVLSSESSQPILFIAYNEGFAPIKSLIEHAISIDTVESIHLYWIVSANQNHYLSNLARSWVDALDNFHYSEYTATNSEQLREQLTNIVSDYPDLSRFKVYIAGSRQVIDLAQQILSKQSLMVEQFYSALL
jgi:CDP-4-dehydro-6-deoxyglucose reductase